MLKGIINAHIKNSFMKKGILLVFISCFMMQVSFADQLAWLSKADAQKGAEFIENAKKVIFFCGCCDKSAVEKIKVLGVEVKHTGTDEFYEIHVSYNYHGETKSAPVDLAYVWVKTKGGLQTVGQALGMTCDPCKSPGK
jgi:hypothetical protein